MIVSERRPITRRLPSAVSSPRSPVASTPPVTDGLTVGPLTRISPSGDSVTRVQNSGGPALAPRSPGTCVATWEQASVSP